MKAGRIFTVSVLALAAFGLGMIVGQKRPAKAAVTHVPQDLVIAKQKADLPAVKHRTNASAASDNAAATHKPSSVAEIEAGLLEALRSSRSQRYKVLNDLVQSINSADMPQILAWVEELASANYKAQLRPMLLSRW